MAAPATRIAVPARPVQTGSASTCHAGKERPAMTTTAARTSVARAIAIASGGRFAPTRNALRLPPAHRWTLASVRKAKAGTIRAATADRAPLFRTKPISTLRICIAMSARKRETILRNAKTA